MGSSSVTGKRIGADVGPCHTYRFHLIPVKSARQNRLEWQSSRLAPFGTKQELILTATTHTPLSHSLRQERKETDRERDTHTKGRERQPRGPFCQTDTRVGGREGNILEDLQHTNKRRSRRNIGKARTEDEFRVWKQIFLKTDQFHRLLAKRV